LKISFNKSAGDHLPRIKKIRDIKDNKRDINKNLKILKIFFIKKYDKSL
jgi:hypothetical protein